MRLTVNNELIETRDASPDMTLLHFLRTHRGLTGTKEGCASGDCGACTVIIACEGADDTEFRTVNSCIFPLGSVHDQGVITVEGLGGDSVTQAVHPVQDAMVNCDGSQCGFCTPGFVMSLAGLHLDVRKKGLTSVSRESVLDAISGNLCRCTGYRPIVEAGLKAMEKPVDMTRFAQQQGRAAPESGSLLGSGGDQGYWRPGSEAEFQSILADHPEARLVAGGTDLMLETTQQFRALPKLIDLNRVASLREIKKTDEIVEVGASVTYSQLETALADEAPELVCMLERLGSRQIRNSGTIGGNIGNASPIADMPPFLLVMDAELVIRNAAGESRRERLCDFYLDYRSTTLGAGEYIACVRFYRTRPGQQLRIYKLSKRYEDDITAVMGAFLLDPDDGLKMAYGGMAAIPARAWESEAAINRNHPWTDEGADEALEEACARLKHEFTPLTDVRASAAYRSEMACNLLRKAWDVFGLTRGGRYRREELFHHDEIH